MTAVDFFGPMPNQPIATVTQARGLFRGLGATGVYPANYGLYSTDFACSDGGDLDVTVAAGEALVDGIYAAASSAKTVTLDAADPTDDRIDLVVLELDPSAGTITLEKVTGTPDPSPTAPSPTQLFGGTYQLVLAEVTVPGGSAVLGTITDARTFATMLGAGNPSDGDTMVYDAASGLWVPGSATSPTASSFHINGGDQEYSHVNFASIAVDASTWTNFRRVSSSGVVNNEVVFLLPSPLEAGTWTFTLMHQQASNRGIYTIAVSPDASTWTDLTTIDGYAGSTTNTRSAATSVTVAADMAYVRLKMATKNASASDYFGFWTFFSGVRTGA